MATQWALTVLIVWLFAWHQPLRASEADDSRALERLFSHCRQQEAEAEGLTYSADVYLHQDMYTRRRGPVVRYIPGMLRLERGLHHYTTEAQLRMQLHKEGDMDCRAVAYHSTARYQRPDRFGGMGKFNFHIYSSKLFIDCLLNPFSPRNRHFYRYRHLGSFACTDTLPAFERIAFSRRFQNDQLAEGTVDVDSLSGAVLRFRLQFRYRFQLITVTAEMGNEGYERCLPVRMHLTSDFRLFGNRVFEETDVATSYSFRCDLPGQQEQSKRFDLTDQCLLRIDTAKVITSPSYFSAIRPQRLTASLVPDFYVQEAELSHSPADSTDTQQGERKYILSEQTQEVLLSSHKFNLLQNGSAQVTLPPILTPSMVQWGGARGLSLKMRVKFSLNKQPQTLPNRFEFNPSIGYSFKQKQVYWTLPAVLRCLPRVSGLFTAEMGGGSHSYNNGQAEELHRELDGVERFDTLLHIIDSYGFHDYRDLYAQGDFTLSPVPGLNITAGVRYHRRTLINFNRLAALTGLTHRFNTIGPRIQVEWTPCQYFYRQGNRRIPLYSRYPTFILNYERGYDISSGDANFERIESDIRYRLPLYAMRTIYMRAGVGFFLHRGKDCFLDYDFFRFSYVPQGWTDELTGEYQLLNARWYNESHYYVRFTGTYESPMMVLSRIPGLSRIVQKERLYVNLLGVQSLGVYTELGYGISTHLVDLGAFTALRRDRSMSFGCKFVLHFFDN